ncbi:MAG TPA: hypothetical protein ENI95_08945 [Chloroflexi bacterium]|nr:hypothetical protein [Chloroflexota bacterium]
MSRSSLEHPNILDLLPAYALGCLDEDEKALVAEHLAVCSACREELRSYEHLVDRLALAAPDAEPSPALKQRLMAQLSPAPPGAQPRRSGRFRLPRLSPVWRVAALAAVFLLVLGGFALGWQALNPPPSQVVELRGTEITPQARGVLKIENERHARLTVTGLPPLDESKQYQLWLIEPDGKRYSGGVFSVASDGSATLQISLPHPPESYSAVGITIEPAGGSPGPTGDKVLGGDF